MTQYGKGEWIENMEGDFEWSPAEEVRTMTREPLPFKISICIYVFILLTPIRKCFKRK